MFDDGSPVPAYLLAQELKPPVGGWPSLDMRAPTSVDMNSIKAFAGLIPNELLTALMTQSIPAGADEKMVGALRIMTLYWESRH